MRSVISIARCHGISRNRFIFEYFIIKSHRYIVCKNNHKYN
nr:MAG TPA: hypothetical protein [Caudoviricetes sp.]